MKDEKAHLVQDLELKKLNTDLQEYLNGIDTDGITVDNLVQTQSMIIHYLAMIAKQYGIDTPIRIELEIIGKDVKIISKNLLTFCMMEGLNPNEKNIVDNELYTFWEFNTGSIRLIKATGAIQFIPGIILRHFDSKSIIV